MYLIIFIYIINIKIKAVMNKKIFSSDISIYFLKSFSSKNFFLKWFKKINRNIAWKICFYLYYYHHDNKVQHSTFYPSTLVHIIQKRLCELARAGDDFICNNYHMTKYEALNYWKYPKNTHWHVYSNFTIFWNPQVCQGISGYFNQQ